MFKRVSKATSRKDKVDQLKELTGDDTAVAIDKMVDESSDSDTDSEDESVSSKNEADSDVDDTNEDVSSRSGDQDEDEPEEQEEADTGVSIQDALTDPIYVPTSGEKKHGELASRCLICSAAVLKSPHQVSSHLESKNHSRRTTRFEAFVSQQLNPSDRQSLDARDAVERMDNWNEQQKESTKMASQTTKSPVVSKRKKAKLEYRKMRTQRLKQSRAAKRKNQGTQPPDGDANAKGGNRAEPKKRKTNSQRSSPKKDDANSV
ncbi:hypothetical protein BCV70DRAFT_190423 [Testicularia cyperi]|uniref:Uncharacterized protein n=1 Tax=Testicularia cyperi TaxID=1882483 RepID=A0A317XMP8_9BASI|nr:hypothetical protein BCV70DRAFT_190423 [Testicularia cyperi]